MGIECFREPLSWENWNATVYVLFLLFYNGGGVVPIVSEGGSCQGQLLAYLWRVLMG